MALSRPARVALRLVAWTVAALGAVLVIAAIAGLLVLQSSWGHERIRRLAVSQANRFLAARLEIGTLEGSILGGVTLHDVRLSRDGTDIVRIDRVEVVYSLRQFFGDAIVIRRLRLLGLRLAVEREEDGRWNLASLVRPRAPRPQDSGGRRPVRLQQIEIADGDIRIHDPLTLGFARVPTTYASLEALFSFTLLRDGWQLDMAHVAWIGDAPFPARMHVSGVVANGPGGWRFERVHVRSARSELRVDGRVDRSTTPPGLELTVDADRWAFQEWAGVVPALRNMAVESEFDASLRGSVGRFDTEIRLTSDGGGVGGRFVIDTARPGWRLSGRASLARLDLARWLNRPDRSSDISGVAEVALAFAEGARFPTGTWAFDGAHAGFLEYESGEVQAAGAITARNVVIEQAIATAYGANVRLRRGTIGLERPFPFAFSGAAGGLDLRRLPAPVPVPNVESRLTMDFEVDGQFSEPFLAGRASFAASSFLGAAIAEGATGWLDTRGERVQYAGEGTVQGLEIARVASDFSLAWLSDPRYHGVLSGRFAVEGSGSGAAIALRSRGRLHEARLFGGRFSEADVRLDLRDGSLAAAFEGRFEGIDPALAFADDRFHATLTGEGRATVAIEDLLVESPALDAYDVDANLRLDGSSISGVPIDTARIDARLEGAVLTGVVEVIGPAVEGALSGSLPVGDSHEASLTFDIRRADLQRLGERLGRPLAGQVAASGRVSGRLSDLRTEGTVEATSIVIDRLEALGARGSFGLTITAVDSPALLAAGFAGELTLVTVGGQAIDLVTGTAAYDEGRLTTDLRISGLRGASGVLSGSARVAPDLTSAAVSRLAFGLNESVWELVPAASAPVVVWNAEGITLEPMAFTSQQDRSQHLQVAGTWRTDGAGRLDIVADGVQLADVAAALGQPDSYAGLLNLDVTVTGTSDQPIVTGDLLITQGRIRQLEYEQLFGRVVYVNGMFELGVRLDQAPGVWLTASGAFPLGLIDRTQPEMPMYVAIASTPISLGLVEGLTDVVRNVTGQVELNVSAVGTSHDPRFTGEVRLAGAGFVVAATGARYERGSGTVTLTRDRMTVDALRIYDEQGNALDVQGSVGTAELRLQDLALDVVAREFQVLRNRYGTVDVDARLTLSGRIEAPVLNGTVTIADGDLQVDRILDRMLFSPYAVEAAPIVEMPVDAIAALNPWDRLALDIALDVPNTLEMVGDNVQVAAGTPLGVGNINVRVAGNLFLRKEPGGELVVIGGLDRLTGRYAFQGRRFDLDPSSTVAFAGDLDPELSVTVTRVISGVETRVTISGRLSEPELQLASNPPLDPTDILSLIVFNTSVNQLTLEQQEQLAVRAGTLAAGFLTAPLITALERTLGLDVLEIEPGATGARVTIGDEIAPGLVARFSRQFGTEEYDEATIEYHLSRLFRIRATFSDAGSVVRSPFRRVERAGIDLLLFFSF